MNFLAIFASVDTLVKGIETLVQTFETSGNGEAKKKAVLSTLGTTFDIASQTNSLPFKKDEVLQFADATINSIVTLKNDIGLFGHQVVADVTQGVQSIGKDIEQVGKDVVNTVEKVAGDVVDDVKKVIAPLQ